MPDSLGPETSLLSFDEEFYLLSNPDVAAAIDSGAFDGDAEDHYIEFGDAEGRDPNAFFDVTFYFATNLDAAAEVELGLFSTSLAHYERIGVVEGRANLPDPLLVFDATFYLASNPDVLEAIVTGDFGDPARIEASAFSHFVFNGAAEGRAPNLLTASPETILQLNRAALLAEEDGPLPSRGDFVEGRVDVIEARADVFLEVITPLPLDESGDPQISSIDLGGPLFDFSFL